MAQASPRVLQTVSSFTLHLCCAVFFFTLQSTRAQPGFQNLVFYVGGIPLFIDLSHDSDPAQVAANCCEELVQLGQENLDIPKCRDSFVSSLRISIEELRIDVQLGRERTTFEDEARRQVLTGMDMLGAFQDFLQDCRSSPEDSSATAHFLFNPEDPHLCVPLPAAFTAIPLQPIFPISNVVVDFQGGRTAVEQDCAVPSVVPSRRFDCERHAAATTPSQRWLPFTPLYPAVDEELFEWLDVLAAVQDAPPHAPLRVLEVGAGHAPWALRAAAANRALSQRPLHIRLVEAHPKALSELREHAALNALPPASLAVFHAAIGPRDGKAFFHTGACSLTTGHGEPQLVGEEEAEGGGGREEGVEVVAVVTLERVLAGWPRVDLVDIDVQGAEKYAVPAGMAALSAKARRVHIGTHSLAIHQQLRHLLRHHNWTIHEDWPPQSRTRTRFGWVSFRDGVLSALNPAAPDPASEPQPHPS